MSEKSSKTQICSACGFPVSTRNISYAAQTAVSKCYLCGLPTYNMYVYGESNYELPTKQMQVDSSVKSKETLVNELHSTIQSNDAQNIFRAGSFNLLKYRYKDITAITKAMYMILEHKLNICGIQEFMTFPLFDFIEKTKLPGAYDYVEFGHQIDLHGGHAGNAIVSHNYMYNTTNVHYEKHNAPDGLDQQGYIKTTIKINGKDVSVYNTHLYYNSDTVVRNQMQELANAIKNDPTTYKIVVGDFNAYPNNGDYKALTNLGFTLSIPASANTIDNVLVSSNIEVLSYKIVSTPEEVTDHNLVYAELKLN